MQKRLLACILTLSFAASSGMVRAATVQEHNVCVGEYAITCKNRYPAMNIEFYGCGPTEKDAICYQYCGQPEEPGKCSQTRLGGPDAGNKCGYSWVTVRCYK